MSDSSFAEIASLFQDSLIDLTTNDRWQIGNLTMIAKEHIEAAQEISTTLEAHIKNVSRFTCPLLICCIASPASLV